jgi:hypothetical protein
MRLAFLRLVATSLACLIAVARDAAPARPPNPPVVQVTSSSANATALAPRQWRENARTIPFPDGTDTLSFENLEGIVLVEASTSNGAGVDTAGKWVVDTGAGYLAVDEPLARKLGIIDGKRGTRDAIDLTQRPVPRFRMGTLDRNQVEPALTFDAAMVRDITDRPVLGLVGQQVYRDRALWIDYQQELMALVPVITHSDTALAITRSRAALNDVLSARAVGLPFQLVGDAKVVITVEMPDASRNGRSDPLTMIVDTGSSKTVLFEDALGERVRGVANWRSVRGLHAPTLVGPAVARVTLAPWVALLGAEDRNAADLVRVRDTDVVLVESRLGDLLTRVTGMPIHGLIGYSFLRHYRIAIDYPNQVLWLDRVPDLPVERPNEYSQVGVQIERRDGIARVVAVAKDSPAERAGIKAGDELLAVDGEAVRPGELNEAARRLEGPPGTWVRLMIQRDGVPREFRIKRVRLL